MSIHVTTGPIVPLIAGILILVMIWVDECEVRVKD
jgi:hypothetical protein